MEPNAWEVEHYVEASDAKQESWARFADRLTRLRGSPGSILEIGCAAGWLLKAARDRGWQVSGLEPSPKFHQYAEQTLNLPVRLGTIDDVGQVERTPFDVIVATDVIEHLQDPVTDLRRLRDAVADDGYLILTTCDIDSLCARFYGLHWRQIVISHTVYWTRKAMSQALAKAGFAVEYFSEPRYWDPDRATEWRSRMREIGKFGVRAVMHMSYMPLAKRFRPIRGLTSTLTRGKLTQEVLDHKIGDQPVLGDVMLVVARPRRAVR